MQEVLLVENHVQSFFDSSSLKTKKKKLAIVEKLSIYKMIISQVDTPEGLVFTDDFVKYMKNNYFTSLKKYNTQDLEKELLKSTNHLEDDVEYYEKYTQISFTSEYISFALQPIIIEVEGSYKIIDVNLRIMDNGIRIFSFKVYFKSVALNDFINYWNGSKEVKAYMPTAMFKFEKDLKESIKFQPISITQINFSMKKIGGSHNIMDAIERYMFIILIIIKIYQLDIWNLLHQKWVRGMIMS